MANVAMPEKNRRLGVFLLLLAFATLACALATQLGNGTPTPERVQTATSNNRPATHTLSPSTTASPTQRPAASSTPAPTFSPIPTITAEAVAPSATATDLPVGGGLQDLVEVPHPLPKGVTLVRDPVSADDVANAQKLAHTDVPVRDLRSLAIRLRGVRADVPTVISDSSPDYEIGALRTFKVHDDDSQETFLIEAELRYKTEHLYMWVETNVELDQGKLENAADTFENRIYPANRSFFGSEWTPGVDGDPHISILHAQRIGSSVAGYYWSTDEYPAEVRPDSNQMEMFYINASNANVGSAFYLGTLAHEFQHMIHWYNDRNEETWLNEGLSELASLINGFDPGGSDYSWSVQPDTQLTTWSDDDARFAHYGGAYLFATYLLDRFGEELTQAVVAHPENGITSIDSVLTERNTGLSFVDVFADWTAAVYLDNPTLLDGQFGYDLIDPPQPKLDAEHTRYPVERFARVAPYGVDYVFLDGGADLTLDFHGDTRAHLIDASTASDDFFWYANRGDDSDMRLTKVFDLSGLSGATLRFTTWYDIETNWDYGYVMVSNNDGATWQILRGPSAIDANPNGNSYGWGYTGRNEDYPQWSEEEIDLSSYAGQQITVRFEYITDDAINYPGWGIDDIAIPELSYKDDVKDGEGGWQAEGFVRTNNHIPQNYLVQLITFGQETSVQRMPLQDDNSARWHLPLADADHAVLMVSSLARVTTEPARYFYRIVEK
jgi:immune inhibitor A